MKVQNLLTLAATAALISSASATVNMDWVAVGNANNAADSRTGYGSVDHAYQIGKFEVTNAQYAEFLNAKGASNANGIYSSNMSGTGITQAGDSGSYSYSVTTALANRPVVHVSWFDAARFANWMMNGQGSGDTETGAYTLNGAISGIFFANAAAQVYLPSENEWYKAAYYNAVNASYSLYANGKDTITAADANYGSGASTNVGSYSGVVSSYGTYDQSGNVWEWSDAVVSASRGLRGGSWLNSFGNAFDGVSGTASLIRGYIPPADEYLSVGFRLASVPEPTSIFLTMFAGGMMLIRRKR